MPAAREKGGPLLWHHLDLAQEIDVGAPNHMP